MLIAVRHAVHPCGLHILEALPVARLVSLVSVAVLSRGRKPRDADVTAPVSA